MVFLGQIPTIGQVGGAAIAIAGVIVMMVGKR